jgi:hypothetical protein
MPCKSFGAFAKVLGRFDGGFSISLSEFVLRQ